MILANPGPHFDLRPAPFACPPPGPGQVLIRVHASSVNPVDAKIALGALPALTPPDPAILGTDVAGLVEAVGPGVCDFVPGDPVFGVAGGVGSLAGAWATHQLADARLLARAPESLPLTHAAPLALVGITAAEALAHIRPHRGLKLLILGAAGGVGHVALQLAADAGADITAVASAPHADALHQLGARHVISSIDPDLDRRLTDGAPEGFDAVLDTVGGASLDRALRHARPYGQVVTTLALSAHDLTPAHARALSVHVVYMLIPLLHGAGLHRHRPNLQWLAQRADAGRLKPLIARSFGFSQARHAVAALQAGGNLGKVALHNDLMETAP